MADEVTPAPAPAATPVPVSDIPVHPANQKTRATDGKFLGSAVSGKPEPGQEPAKPAPAAPPPPAEDPVSARLAAAAKKERLNAQTISELKAELASLKSKPPPPPPADPVADLRKAPLTAVAKALGVTAKEAYDIITQQALSTDPETAPSPAELRAIRAEQAVEELRAELKAEKDKQLEDARKYTQEQEQAVLEGFRGECNTVFGAPETKTKFELATHFATGDDVYQLIVGHWNKQVQDRTPNPRALTIEQALQMLEDHFEKQVVTGLSLSKVKAKVQPAPEGRPQTSERPSAQPAPITSRMSPTTPASPSASASGLASREERLAKAIAAFEANRKK